ncbi:acyl-protein synthetase, LuxE [Haliscomenobacter hydrossis DSM 1100]|uniref:Acyl-protein synthetase, LuxE n=2 Tax=Haliscomenobacter TaxID=2349 RepID=F4L7I0_HALH1|nr:acyl-protein synthetase, LuxE [Haliscomenobacter hydrossis DSM 1100]
MLFQSARSHLYELIQKVTPGNFEMLALQVFRFQARFNPLYARYLDLLHIDVPSIERLENIPCLPIQLFKQYEIKTGEWPAEQVFSSSGTTGLQTSTHAVRSLEDYTHNARLGFETFYGTLNDYCFLALLPAYLERGGSSLVYMAEQFVHLSKYPQSGFYLYDHDALRQTLAECAAKKIPTVLIGVSFALWDLAEEGGVDFPELIVMETGGMKGRRRELTRVELHDILCKGLKVKQIHSEYGMTELLSQAYSQGEGLFRPAPTMRVWAREVTDPFQVMGYERSGALNVIDLANLDTIAFISTDDLGKVYADGTFEVLGRLDAGDVRGCNLLVS